MPYLTTSMQHCIYVFMIKYVPARLLDWFLQLIVIAHREFFFYLVNSEYLYDTGECVLDFIIFIMTLGQHLF